MEHPPRSGPAFPERRLYRRYPLDLGMEVRPDTDPKADAASLASLLCSCRVILENLSLSGLLFIAPRSFAPETLLWARLRLGLRTYEVKGLVRRVTSETQAGRKQYHIGLQFVHCPQTAQFIAAAASFLEQHPPAPSSKP